MEQNKVIVRFPPSPTGLFHVGSARTALYNYLYAKQNGGKFILRIEDTDKERSNKEYEQDLFESLDWLGLKFDNVSKEEVWRQSTRTPVYKKYLEKLIAEGKAYLSKEEVTEEGQRPEVIRFKNPNKKIIFKDLIRGDIEFDTTELKDFVIAKSLEEPIYHLAVVIDDFETGVTHIMRGDDGISNTPRQILIQEAIGAPRPIYAHLPLILAPDQTKLSKRKHGEQVSVLYYKSKGYLPEAVINFLVMVGWNPGTNQEIFSLEELIKIFDITKVQKKGAIFNIEKLDWINREYILHMPYELLIKNLYIEVSKTKFKNSEKWQDRDFLEKFLKIILDRIHRFGEISEVLEAGEFDYLFERPTLVENKILWKEESREEAIENLGTVSKILDKKEEIMQYAKEKGKGEVLWPLRYSLSGKEKSPDPFTLIDILGIKESQARISDSIEILSRNK